MERKDVAVVEDGMEEKVGAERATGGRVAAVKPNDGKEGRVGRRWNGRTVGVKKGNRRSGCGRDGVACCRGLVKLPVDRCNCGQEPFGWVRWRPSMGRLSMVWKADGGSEKV